MAPAPKTLTKSEKLPAIGRKTPYTEIGISRVPCLRCGAPAAEQFNICALDGRFVPVCVECDVLLNALVLDFLDAPKKDERLRLYREKMQGHS